MRKEAEQNNRGEIPERLLPKEIKKIMDEFGKYGLRDDEDLEHFTFIKPNGNKSFIPKRDKIFFADGSSVKTKKYLREFLLENGVNIEVEQKLDEIDV